MKKRAALLAMAAMLALTPVAAFAGSDNSVTKVVDVKDDAILGDSDWDTVDGKDANIVDAPFVKMENDGGDWDEEETFELKLTNAEWLADKDEDYDGNKIKELNGDDKFKDLLTSKIEFELPSSKLGSGETVADYVYVDSVERKSDSKIKVIVAAKKAGQKLPTDLVVKVPMWVEMDGSGEGTVEIASKDGSITEETLKFANGADGDTKITIEDTTDFSNRGLVESIEIEENAAGALPMNDMEYIELEVTKDFTFSELTTEELKSLGESSPKSGVKYYGKITGDFIGGNYYVTNENAKLDDEKIKIYFNTDKGYSEAQGDKVNDNKVSKSELVEVKSYTNGVGAIELNGFMVKATNDADQGKVNVTVRSNLDEIDTTKLEMGTYAEYAMTVKADDEPTTIFSGFYEDATVKKGTDREDDATGASVETDSEDHELVKLIIEEDVDGTWDLEKEVTVKLPEWVKIMNTKIEGDSKDNVKEVSIDNNEFEFTLKDGDKDRSVELTFYVSVEAGKEGDIEALVTGRALDKEEFKVVLGKAVAPVKVEAEVAKIKAGVRKQELGKITISETAEETIKEGKIIVELDKDIEWDDEPKVEVVKGDLEIDEDDIDVEDNILTILVTEESDEASVIEITNADVTADRAIAEGSIEVEVKGDALIRNGFAKDYDDNGVNSVEYAFKNSDGTYPDITKSDAVDEYAVFSNDEYAKLEVANVITPADDDVMAAEEAKFVIGSTEYMVGEEVKVADVAPYIKDGRTMLSLKYVAEAVGVPTSNVIWNGEERSVTIMKGDRIAKVVIDSDVLLVNGTPIKMDTAAEIKSGRTMLPVSFIGKALGAEIGWDGATKTVTIK